ncbi:hypothetical protein ACPPVT_06370 [Angustibacter sp. McL0619]|uniref:hypothetical protein n=1 Tax=Angustibacter sp. McL0619 TaxID=3415676 RepID=UPI003CE9AE2A
MLILAIATAASSVLLSAAPSAAANPAPIEHEHTVTTVPAEGRFTCGDLVLTINGGTETEVFDGVLVHGVAVVRIHRLWNGVTLTGSDRRSYRATANTRAKFVLVDPDFDNPIWGHEVVVVRFRGGPTGSPGRLREEITIRNGVETDVVSGRCDFAE